MRDCSRCTGGVSRGFTLIELLVVVAIIAVLIAILIPSLSKARDAARTSHCASNMRQWGIALQLYENENNLWTPQEGDTSTEANISSPAAWFNALPNYCNAPQYYLLYAGNKNRIGITEVDSNGMSWTIGATDSVGYKNSNVWYCQGQLSKTKNSATNSAGNTGLNSFHYVMNAVLDGAGSTATWGTTAIPKDPGTAHVKATFFDDPQSTVFFFESTGITAPEDTPANSPRTTSTYADNMDTTRHSTATNVTYADGHVECLRMSKVPLPTLAPDTQVWTTRSPRLIFGPFPATVVK